jgi:hypothetical protein
MPARRFFGNAEMILAEQRLAERELEASAGAALVPAAVGLFSALPDVALSVLEAEPEEAVPMLRTGELEVVIVGAPDQPEGFGDLYDRIDLHHLFDEPRYALLPLEHRLPRRKRLRLQDLAAKRASSSPAAPPGRAA